MGFWPGEAYRTAALQKKMLLLIAAEHSVRSYAGHLLFGGVFPNARVFQTCVAKPFRRLGAGTILIRALTSQLEADGYLSIAASVAADLDVANGFYAAHGFDAIRTRPGGDSKNRSIIVRVKQLDTPSLFKLASERAALNRLPIRIETSVEIPLYVIDINVLLDLVRRRTRAEAAGALVEATLAHNIRLAVTSEFVAELERSSPDVRNDPLLEFSKRLPTLPPVNPRTLADVAKRVEQVVFTRGTRTAPLRPNAKSDARHIAHAALAGCTGYITSDEALLRSWEELRSSLRVDVIGLTEIAAPLLHTIGEAIPAVTSAAGLTVRCTRDLDEVRLFFEKCGSQIPSDFLHGAGQHITCYVAGDANGIVGASVVLSASTPLGAAKLCMVVEERHPFASTIVEYFLSQASGDISKKAITRIDLFDTPSNALVRKLAVSHGFQTSGDLKGMLTKIAVGRIITARNWTDVVRRIANLTGLQFQQNPPDLNVGRSVCIIQSRTGQQLELDIADLETLLSPALFAVSGRNATIVPITRPFSRDLIGAEDQFTLLDSFEAGLLARRTYLNSPRAAGCMGRGTLLVFYESTSSGGRGAVAVARAVTSFVTPKSKLPKRVQRETVVSDIDKLSKSENILATTFDNLIPFAHPVSLGQLRKLGCVGPQNLRTATRISSDHLLALLRSAKADG